MTEEDLIREVHKICKRYNIENYTINEDMSIDVDDDAIISHLMLNKIPVNFNNVAGTFDCSDNNIRSLKGCPKFTGGDFYCNSNYITKLPGTIERCRSFDCRFNELTSLEGAPKIITESWYLNDSLRLFPEYKRYLLTKKIKEYC